MWTSSFWKHFRFRNEHNIYLLSPLSFVFNLNSGTQKFLDDDAYPPVYKKKNESADKFENRYYYDGLFPQ